MSESNVSLDIFHNGLVVMLKDMGQHSLFAIPKWLAWWWHPDATVGPVKFCHTR